MTVNSASAERATQVPAMIASRRYTTQRRSVHRKYTASIGLKKTANTAPASPSHSTNSNHPRRAIDGAFDKWAHQGLGMRWRMSSAGPCVRPSGGWGAERYWAYSIRPRAAIRTSQRDEVGWLTRMANSGTRLDSDRPAEPAGHMSCRGPSRRGIADSADAHGQSRVRRHVPAPSKNLLQHPGDKRDRSEERGGGKRNPSCGSKSLTHVHPATLPYTAATWARDILPRAVSTFSVPLICERPRE
jgi:hypothetical protein